MLFNSAIFILLFFFTYMIYWNVSLRGKHFIIILASLLFYAWYSFPFLSLFLIIIVINYAIAMKLLQNKSKKLLAFIIALDILNLGLFKYFYLFVSGIGYVVGSDYLISLRENWIADYKFEIILPIAISFYTFQIIAFVVDCYRGTVNEPVPFRQFLIFKLFFPQFAAGPIMRAHDFLPQIDHPSASVDKVFNGCLLILMGIVKKVLIADRIGSITKGVWAAPQDYDAVYLILILPAFISQIYCDFSGYTDMARGMAKLLGYEMPENFRGPFLATTMQGLWQRWHITLSTWLRDYLYIPLGGSRVSEFRSYINILITMAIGGFWHGATWPMLIWGVYMGLVQITERFVTSHNIRFLPETKWANVIRVIRTYILFAGSAVLFASPSLDKTLTVLKGIFTFQRGIAVSAPETLISLIIVTYLFNVLQFGSSIKSYITQHHRLRLGLVIAGTLFVGILVEIYGDVSGSFLYFAF